MAVEKMMLVRLYGRVDTLNTVLSNCITSGVFQPEAPLQGSVKIGGISEESNPRSEVMAKLTELSGSESLNPDIKNLINSRYLRVRVGTIPNANVALIDDKNTHFQYVTLTKGEETQRGFFVTTEDDLTEAEDIFAGYGFRPDGDAIGFTAMSNENPYQQTLANMEEVASLAGLSFDVSGSGIDIEPFEVDRFLSKFREEFMKLSDARKDLERVRTETRDELNFLEHMGNENLEPIMRSGFFKVKFGRLPSGSFDKLSYYSDRQFIFITFSEDKHYHWGFYVTIEDDLAEIDDVFQSLSFENVWLSDGIFGNADTARANMNDTLDGIDAKIAAIDGEVARLVSDNRSYFVSVYSALRRMNAAYGLRKFVGVHDSMFRLEGFVPKSESKRFSAMFETIPGLELSFHNHDSDQRLEVPTKLKNSKLWKPFEMFVDMYGVPGYHEMDPTPFLALTYTLLFGMMFGDLGQGIVIALVGLFLWRVKKMQFGEILIRIGGCSAIFGLIYGSVFGLEDLLDPLYLAIGLSGKPIDVMEPSMINMLLIAAVGIGAALIIITIILNIYQGIKKRDIVRAVFSNNGVAGLIFYGGLLTAVVCMVTGGPNLLIPQYIIPVVVVPILVIFAKESLGRVIEGHGKFIPEGETIGGWFIESFFELFEIVLSFITNTMSFLRVGGFVISHAGMMMVVMILMDMARGAGSYVVLAIGNVFVIGLEGFIVGIQVLRLQFYELFSHYYEGQGKQFEPYKY